MNYGSGYLLALVALVLMLLIIPSAASATRWMKPSWRAWLWPLTFAGLAASSLCSALAATFDLQDLAHPLWKAVQLLAGLAFTFLTFNALYRVVPDTLARRFAPLIWATYLVFAIAILAFHTFLLVLIYDAACAVLVFIAYSTLYARDPDRSTDALPIMIGTGLVLVADLIASFDFTFSVGSLSFTQLLPFNLLTLVALVFFFKGASSSYSVKYDLQRSRERALSSGQ